MGSIEIAAFPFFNNSLALAGWQGINGFLFLSNTKTRCTVFPMEVTSQSPFRVKVSLANVILAFYVQHTDFSTP